MGAKEPNGRLAAVARSQHGVVDRAQALRAGVSSSGLVRRVGDQRLERLHAGVFRVAGAPATWRQEVLAAVLAAGGDAVASHRTAARMWGLCDGEAGPIEVTVSRSRSPRPTGVTVHRSKDLHADWCGRRHGIPVTNPARTLVDLGAVGPDIVEDAVERALVTGLVTVDGLEATRAAHARPGRRGCGVLRAVLEQRALGERPADSVLEARMAALLSRHGFPVPAFQHEVRDHAGRFVARVDFAYPSARLAIEVDGLATHGTAPALQADLARQNRLVALGWTVLRFTWEDVVRRPAVVALSIARTHSRLS